MPSTSLPIWQIHPQIISTLQSSNRLVLVAPTGSGKTTQVPQMLLDAGLAQEQQILVLQPRRVAARSVAARVAQERSSRLGTEVGYQIRFDDQTSLGTRICFVTEGILLRWLQDNPSLPQIAVILFDEFHERNLFSDAALALVKQLQKTSRPDLKLVVMSATLDTQPVSLYLDNCPTLVSEGQSHPVEINFLPSHDDQSLPDQAALALEELIHNGEQGDVLIFMPGMGEINATLQAIRSRPIHERLALLPLHGDLPPQDQDLAFAPNPLRKIIVSTNVAETSVTIDGIRHVIDSGVARVARYDPERGIGTLVLEPISRASADQRKGRAGRTAPGTCLRLWTESGHLNRPERITPEIQRSDLAEIVLLLHSLHIRQAVHFDWLDKPDPAAVQRAEDLLRTLGALNPDPLSNLTPIGRQMLRLPMHPRYSRMLLEAARHDCVPQAALCAALVSGRDLLIRLRRDDQHIAQARELFETNQDSDFLTLIQAFEFARENRFDLERCRRHGIHAQTARLVDQTCQQFLQIAQKQRLLNQSQPTSPATTLPTRPLNPTASPDPLLRSIMTGFIDQLCVRRDQGTLDCLLTEGRSGTLQRESVVQKSPLFVAASIREIPSRGSTPLTLLGLASTVKVDWLQTAFPQHLSSRVHHLYDRTHKRVTALKQLQFRDLIIAQEPHKEIDPTAAGRCLADAHLSGCFELPLFNHGLKQFIARVNLASGVFPELEIPPCDAEAITLCLARAFAGLTLAKEAQNIPLQEAIHSHLPSDQISWINELTPLTIPWPDGRKLKLLYQDPPRDNKGEILHPELQIKLHECFHLTEHPRICEGRLPVKLWLCTPAGKRLEPTLDWPSFKAHTYPKLKANLQKKHPGVGWL